MIIIESGVLLIRKAYNIPKSTVHDHVSGKVDPGASVSPPSYSLIKWLEGCAKNVRAIMGAI